MNPEPVDLTPKDPYPEYDPLGLYRPKEKRKHKPLPPKDRKYENMGVHEMLTQLRVKSQLMPRGRSATADVDALLEDLNRPLPKSGVADFTPATVECLDYECEDYTPIGPDNLLKKKIDESRRELDEFDRLLDQRFKSKRSGGQLQSQAAAMAAADQSARESQRQRMMASSIAIEGTFGRDEEVQEERNPRRERAVEEYEFFE